MTFKDYPFDECAKAAEKLVADGHTVHQKFTCNGCGTRLAINEPNVFHETGTCDRCNVVTNIKAKGCNYLVHMRLS